MKLLLTKGFGVSVKPVYGTQLSAGGPPFPVMEVFRVLLGLARAPSHGCSGSTLTKDKSKTQGWHQSSSADCMVQVQTCRREVHMNRD